MVAWRLVSWLLDPVVRVEALAGVIVYWSMVSICLAIATNFANCQLLGYGHNSMNVPNQDGLAT